VTIRILVVDDHPVVREGLVAMLGTERAFEVVGEAGDEASAVATLTATAPDIVLMDIELPPTDGIAATKSVLKQRPDTRVIVFTAFDSEDRIMRAVQAGAQGYLLKGVPREELFAAIRTVAAGGSHLQPQVAARLLHRLSGGATTTPLTDRQLEVVRLLSIGATNKEIARALSVGERTVKYHVAGIFDRLGAGNRTEAVSIALRLGLVTNEPR
jgi:DNA-binding NarL/FixJ family response regulator